MISHIIGTNMSNFRNFDKEGIVDKISKAAKELDFTNDIMGFIEQIISLSILLSNFDPPLSTTYRTIDEKAQDPSYFIATYFDTKDVYQALWVYRMVRLLARYVLLLDRFFEIGDDRYTWMAKRVRASINKFLLNGNENHHLNYSIDYSLKQFCTFWKFEQIIKRRILGGFTFSYNEIRHFNLFKSSDASTIYASVLDAKLPSFNENVSLILHYNQAFLDLQDDWEDIVDDVQEDMPNVFVMAAVKDTPYERIKNSSNESIRNMVLDRSHSSRASIIRLLNEYQESISNICIPDNFAFLKSLSDHYANTLRETFSANPNNMMINK
jgi:hypothetical protein